MTENPETYTYTPPEPPEWRLRVLESRRAWLGTRAKVVLYIKDDQGKVVEIIRDEVRLWQAGSRERFIKLSMKRLGHTSPDFPERVDRMLRDWDEEYSHS